MVLQSQQEVRNGPSRRQWATQSCGSRAAGQCRRHDREGTNKLHGDHLNWVSPCQSLSREGSGMAVCCPNVSEQDGQYLRWAGLSCRQGPRVRGARSGERVRSPQRWSKFSYQKRQKLGQAESGLRLVPGHGQAERSRGAVAKPREWPTKNTRPPPKSLFWTPEKWPRPDDAETRATC